MSFIEMDLDNTQEAQPAPEAEYDLVIEDAEVGMSKNSGKPRIALRIAFEGHPEFMNIRHFLSIPNEEDDPDVSNFKRLMIKRFLHLFGIPSDGGFNTEDFPGARARALVRQTEPNEENEVYNEIVVPKLPREA